MKILRHRRPNVGLALGSGAALGLAHIGVLKALKKAEIPIDMIAGTSMGALIGACFAKEGEISLVEEIALKTDLKQLIRLLDIKFASLKKGFIYGRRIEELLYFLIGDVAFDELKIPLAAITTDINTGQEMVIREGSVIDAVRASISIPAIFVPVKVKDKFLVDGGLVDPVPTNVLRDMGAKFIIAVNVLTAPQRNKPDDSSQKDETLQTPNIFNTLIQSIYIMEHEMVKLRITKMKADIMISPDVSHINAFEFHKGREAIQAGYEAANNVLPELRKLLSDK